MVQQQAFRSYQINVYKACVISTLLYRSESWTMHACQEKRLNVFHMRCLRRILGITWQDKVTNKLVLENAGIPSLYTFLKQRRMRWLGHVTRMKDGRILKEILLYGELATGKRPTGRPQLRFKDVCKRDLQTLGINTDSWEVTATDSRPTTASHVPSVVGTATPELVFTTSSDAAQWVQIYGLLRPTDASELFSLASSSVLL